MKAAKLVYRLIVLLFCTQLVFAQNQNADANLIASYDDYTEMDRELVFLHLNKSVYIKGESIGVKAYVLDKHSKTLASQASNLYCVISDESGKTIESQLLMVNNGVAIGDFELGETYTSGQYTVKAYTNWMRNFNEQNLYIETFRIIDPAIEKQIVLETKSKKIDAQFLPEGGHLLVDTENILGIVVKNEKGLGAADVEGEIVDQNNVVVTNFKLNQFGIGKCLLTPIAGNNYSAKFTYGDIEQRIDIGNIELKGIAMSVTSLRDKVAVTIKTNANTLGNVKNAIYKLVIHNGKNLKELPFKFSKQPAVNKVIANKDLFAGLNIFTIFDAKNNPILERLYFNYNGLKLQTSGESITSVINDSIDVVLPYKVDDASVLNSFSVSILPNETNSFHHQNIVSQVYLQPYVKGYIEQARYYFTDITPKKQFELDNLLITQGWSSYDWNTLFNDPPEYDFDYENGISYTFNATEKGEKQLMIYPTLNHPMQLVTLTKENNSYTAAGLFPIEDESVKIREIDELGKVTKPNLYLQFDPIKIPELKSNLSPIVAEVSGYRLKEMNLSIANTFKNIQKLDEVVVNKKKEYTKIEKLNNRSIGRVEEMDEETIKRYRSLDRYLRDKGFFVQFNSNVGDFVILNNKINSFRDTFTENLALKQNGFAPEIVQEGSSIPIVYLDGMVLHQNFNLLQNLSLEDIEWIEVNISGIGGGMRAGGAGLIRIKTRPTFRTQISTEDVYANYEIPLKFSVAKKFYIPIYSSYETSFFKEFGVIDWIPSLNLSEDGYLKFKIANNKLKYFKVFVEGVINNGTLISEEIQIKIDQL
jgi:hypothetical protein